MAKFVNDTYGPQKIIDYNNYFANKRIEANDFSKAFEFQILNSFFDCDFLHDYYEWAKGQPYLYADAAEEYINTNQVVYYDFSDSAVIIPRQLSIDMRDTREISVNFSKDVTIDCTEAIAYFQAYGLDIKGVGILLRGIDKTTYTIDYHDKNGNLLYHEPASVSEVQISKNIVGATTIKLTNLNKDADSHSRFEILFDSSYGYKGIKNAYYLPYEGAYDNTISWSDDNSKCTYKALSYDGLDDVEVTVDTVSEVILEPTCINDGTIKYTATFDLKDELKEYNVQTKEEKIPALGHKEINDYTEVEATCTTSGKEANKICETCGIILEEGKEIPALGHKLDESFSCTVCGYIDSEAKEKALKEKEAEEQRKLEEEQKEANDRLLRGVCKISFETGCELNVSSYELDKNSSLGTTPVLTRNGYTFNGWYIGNKKAIESYPVKSDLTLTAKWTANKYFIKYNLNGGKAKTTAYYKTGTTTTLPTPTKKGYVFTCYDVFSLTGIVDDNTVTADSYGDITLSANYRPISYTINYHVNDTVTSKTYLYDENIDMISDFINLSDDKSIIAFTKGKTTYSVNKTYTNLATSDGAVIDLYAKLGAKGILHQLLKY